MTQVTLTVPPPLRRFVDGQSKMDLTANSVKEAINHLTVSSEDLKDQLFEKDGRLRRFVRVFVNGEPVSLASDSDPKLKEGSEVTLLLALAGG